VTSAVTNSAARPTAPHGTRQLNHVLQAAGPGVDLIEDVQRLPDGRADRVAPIDELPVVADVLVEVLEQLLGNLDAYLGHLLGALAEHRI
jgi:hypothetical protein